MSITGGGLVARTLKRFGVRHLFSLPGHQILSVYAACIDENMDLVSTRHEASAVYMAQALAYATRQPGVALLAGGPELTNALTGIAQAYFAKTPLVVIAGANTLSKRDKGFPQDMTQLELVRPFTKWARSCHDVRRIPEYIATAYRHALRGRPGPAYVEIPYDVMETKTSVRGVVFPEYPRRIRPCGDADSLGSLAHLLQRSKRPLAIVGSGALWSGAEEELTAFYHKTGVPLLLSNAAMALPLPEEATYGWGSLGVGRPVMEAFAESDLLLLLGTRVNFGLGFGQPPFIAPRQQIAQIDIEPEEIDSNRRIDLAITGDLSSTLRAFNAQDIGFQPNVRWQGRLREKTRRYAQELLSIAKARRTPMHPLWPVLELESVRADDSILVLDGANSSLWMMMAARPHAAGAVVLSTAGELQAIGAGVPQALALKRAHPDRQVILHTGDGSFGYGAMEMETAVRNGIPIVVVIHNDRGWGMTRDMAVEFFGKDKEIGNQLGTVRYDRVVEALGGHGEFVERAEEVRPALERALRAGVPACVNIMVDPRPKSPGLMTFMMMEVMLGKQSTMDRIPDWMRRLSSAGLEGTATRAMMSQLDRMMHRGMKG